MSRSFVISLVVVAVLVVIGGAAGYWVREKDRDAPLGTKADSTTEASFPLKPQEVGDTIYVSVRELGEQPNRAVPFALRELVRQGILLTARDELGLATRDILLREDFPEIPDKKSAPFEMTIAQTGQTQRTLIDYAITRGPKDERVWRGMINVDLNEPQSIATVAEKAEAWSRTDFKDVLTQVGEKDPCQRRELPRKCPPRRPIHFGAGTNSQSWVACGAFTARFTRKANRPNCWQRSSSATPISDP